MPDEMTYFAARKAAKLMYGSELDSNNPRDHFLLDFLAERGLFRCFADGLRINQEGVLVSYASELTPVQHVSMLRGIQKSYDGSSKVLMRNLDESWLYTASDEPYIMRHEGGRVPSAQMTTVIYITDQDSTDTPKLELLRASKERSKVFEYMIESYSAKRRATLTKKLDSVSCYTLRSNLSSVGSALKCLRTTVPAFRRK